MREVPPEEWAQDVQLIAVVGAGTMGEGIAQSLAEAGITVRLIDVDRGAIDECVQRISANLALARECDVWTGDDAALVARIEKTATRCLTQDVRDADVVIETVPEIVSMKRAIFSELDDLPGEVLLASNTSSMPMSVITEGMKTASRAVGLHYFNPAHIIPAVEVHASVKTSQSSIMRASALLRRTKKIPLQIRKEVPGFAINRLTGALSREIANLIDEGVVTPQELDVAVRASLGFRLAWVGPMEGADYIGLDTDIRVSSAIFPELSNRKDPPQLLKEMVERDEFGVKSGKGWFDYSGLSRQELLDRRNRKLLRQLLAWSHEEWK